MSNFKVTMLIFIGNSIAAIAFALAIYILYTHNNQLINAAINQAMR
jgi:hypothetical protein